MDVSGRIVKQFAKETFTEKRGRIPVYDIPSGIYFVVVSTEKNIYQGKFIKL